MNGETRSFYNWINIMIRVCLACHSSLMMMPQSSTLFGLMPLKLLTGARRQDLHVMDRLVRDKLGFLMKLMLTVWIKQVPGCFTLSQLLKICWYIERMYQMHSPKLHLPSRVFTYTPIAHSTSGGYTTSNNPLWKPVTLSLSSQQCKVIQNRLDSGRSMRILSYKA